MRLNIPLHILTFALLIGMFPSASQAEPLTSFQKSKFQPFLTKGRQTTWSISSGLRNNKTDWRSASDITGTQVPNILIQNTFGDITFFELKGKVRHTEPYNISFINGAFVGEAELTGGYMVNGFSQVSGYSGNDRTGEYFRRSTNKLEGDAFGGALTLGYQISLTGTPAYRARKILNSPEPKTTVGKMRKRRALQHAMASPGPYLSVTPLLGLGLDTQTYSIREDVFEVIPNFEQFNSKADYETSWFGPFIGLEGEIKNKKHQLRLRGQYHDLSYDAEFKDASSNALLTQEADGDGITLSGEYAYALGEDYMLTLEGMFQNHKTEKGTQSENFDGVDTGDVLLYELNDESHALRIGLRYIWD